MDSKKTDKIEALIIKSLAEYLGIPESEISPDDSFSEDLHFTSSEFTDFLHLLSKKGMNTDDIDLTNIKNVEDLINYFYEEYV